MPKRHRRSRVYCAAIVLVLAILGLTGLGIGHAPPRFLWGEGTARFHAIPGGNPREALDQAAAGTNVPLWMGSFASQGTTYSYTMVGTDPAAGSQTSVIPVVIIPITFVFSDGTVLSASTPVCGGTESATALATSSPLFENYPFAPGATDVGTTQYIDAFQRANFWHDVSTTSPDYHVRLSATVQPPQTVRVPAWAGATQVGPCARIGTVGIVFFEVVARRLITQLQIPPTSLPVFLTYNTFFTQGRQCCILGYHSATLSNQTYAVAAYNNPGIFSQPIEDINSLSHELAEWLDDPFVSNRTPGWKAGPTAPRQFTREVGDPVAGIAFEAPLNGTTYHPEDLTFVAWFARESPSSAVNGWYTFVNTYPSPPRVCR